MEEQLITFETAKLAKEKRFGMTDDSYIQLSTFYDENGSLIAYEAGVKQTHSSATGSPYGQKTIDDFEAYISVMDNSLDDFVLAPTQSLLQKWLREVYKIELWIGRDSVYNEYKCTGDLDDDRGNVATYFHKTYEKALEKGLQEALKLIKI